MTERSIMPFNVDSRHEWRGVIYLTGVLWLAGVGFAGEKEEDFITEKDRAWWAFQPIGKPVPPKVKGQAFNEVDRFVLAQLEAKGLSLAREAERQVLIRRTTFDLTGLPPSPEEMAAFITDRRSDAYERLVERLLESPHYGERWGRWWLDVARYADTNGGGFDYVYPNAWQYRDYVVRAFNADKPFDRFITEQLAGDLLPVGTDAMAHVDRLTATGFLTLAPKGLGMQDKEQMTLDVVDDQLDVVGRALMGMTISCARCHDHKFDPISTHDYYALAGIFRSTETVNALNSNPSYWPETPLELPSVTAARKQYLARKAANEKATVSTHAKAREALTKQVRQQLPEYLLAAMRHRQTARHVSAAAHWPLDEADGTAVIATVGPGGKLANVNGASAKPPERIDSRLGRALRFAGRGGVVEVGKAPALEFGQDTDFSMALWIRAAKEYTPRTADTILSADYGGAMWFIALRPGPYNGIYLRHYDGKRAVDIKPAQDRRGLLTNGQWHHVVFTSDRSGKGRVYLDGAQVGEVSLGTVGTAAKFEGLKKFRIGASVNAFRGDLDDVAVWQRELSPGEIRALHAEAPRNVAEVETRPRKASVTANTGFSLQKAAKRGLVPGIIRNIVGLLDRAEADPKSPLHRLSMGKPAGQKAVSKLVDLDSTPVTKLLGDAKKRPLVTGSDAKDFYADEFKKKLTQLATEAKAIEQSAVPAPVLAMVAREGKTAADLKVHIAGDRNRLGKIAKRGVPKIFGGEIKVPLKASGRLELARWLTSRRHPLTARVLVNRVWQGHFGEGMVRTPDNFGQLGDEPSHPQLLDWLARRFMEDEWSLKKLHRLLVLSATYRQTSRHDAHSAAVDSGNRLLWRMNRRRLEAEALRDAMLMVSGQLNLKTGGTVNTIWKPKMFSVNDKNEETANYKTNRRSIYLPVVRGAAVHEMLQLFDFGDPNALASRRDTTTNAPQALFLMNSPFVIEQAKHFAARLAADKTLDTTGRVRWAYQLALVRAPTAAELKRAAAFVGEGGEAAWQLFCQSLLCLNEFAWIE